MPSHIAAASRNPEMPANVVSGERCGLARGLRQVVGAIGVDEQFDVGPDRFAGPCDALPVARHVAADLHFHHAHTGGGPSCQLLLQMLDGVGRETTAAVHGDGIAKRAEQRE